MKRSRTATVVASAAIAALALTGCTGGDDTGDNAGGGGGETEESIRVAFVPKLQGSPYFEAMDTGAQRAAEDYENIEWLYQGPTTADAAAQAEVVRSFIQQGVDVLMLAPNDPASMAPLIEEAQAVDISVGTSDTDAPDSSREVFVNQATAEGIGTAVIDSLAEAMGGEGEYAVVSCGETAENLNSWIAVQEEYVAEEYPDMERVDLGYSGEDQAANAQMATDMMNANPNLKGLIGQCTTSAVGVAQAVRDAGRIGEVFSVGVGTPNSMAPYLEDGSSSASILWDVEEFGYLTAWAGLQLGLGEPFAATNEVSESLPAVEYVEDENMLVLGPALVLTTENVGDFDF